MSGPSNIYLRLLRGQTTPERYVAVVKRAVDMSFRIRKRPELRVRRMEGGMTDWRHEYDLLHQSAQLLAAEVAALRADLVEAKEAEQTVRDQHEKVMAAIKGNGLPWSHHEECWRDEDFREWEVWLGRMVECPSCAFTMGADHTDEGGGYSCPSCAEIALRADREAQRRDRDIVIRNRNAQLEVLAARCNRYDLALQRVMEAVTLREAKQIARAGIALAVPSPVAGTDRGEQA